MVYWGCSTTRNRCAWALCTAFAVAATACLCVGAGQMWLCNQRAAGGLQSPQELGSCRVKAGIVMALCPVMVLLGVLPSLLFFQSCMAEAPPQPVDWEQVSRPSAVAAAACLQEADWCWEVVMTGLCWALLGCAGGCGIQYTLEQQSSQYLGDCCSSTCYVIVCQCQCYCCCCRRTCQHQASLSCAARQTEQQCTATMLMGSSYRRQTAAGTWHAHPHHLQSCTQGPAGSQLTMTHSTHQEGVC